LLEGKDEVIATLKGTIEKLEHHLDAHVQHEPADKDPLLKSND
jgi:hypothetical protein